MPSLSAANAFQVSHISTQTFNTHYPMFLKPQHPTIPQQNHGLLNCSFRNTTAKPTGTAI